MAALAFPPLLPVPTILALAAVARSGRGLRDVRRRRRPAQHRDPLLWPMVAGLTVLMMVALTWLLLLALHLR